MSGARAVNMLLRTGSIAITAALAACVLGLLLRDAVPLFAWATYAPAPIVAAVAVAWDTIRRGRAWSRLRFGLLVSSFGLAAVWAAGMIGWTTPQPVPEDATVLRLLQANTHWGGGRNEQPSNWSDILRAIESRGCDIVALSEAPAEPRLSELIERLGADWTMQTIEHAPGESYWYRLVLASRFPVRFLRRDAIASGVTMLCEIETPDAPIRILMVDAESKPWRDRRPTLRDLDAVLQQLGAEDLAPHALVGDFNAPSRSIGFDSLRAAGFRLASESSGQWRGTWRSSLPLFDLDHVWTAPGIGLHACELFPLPHSDHRAQTATLGAPNP